MESLDFLDQMFKDHDLKANQDISHDYVGSWICWDEWRFRENSKVFDEARKNRKDLHGNPMNLQPIDSKRRERELKLFLEGEQLLSQKGIEI